MKRNFKNRIISVGLTLSLVLGNMIPAATVSAAETNEIIATQNGLLETESQETESEESNEMTSDPVQQDVQSDEAEINQKTEPTNGKIAEETEPMGNVDSEESEQKEETPQEEKSEKALYTAPMTFRTGDGPIAGLSFDIEGKTYVTDENGKVTVGPLPFGLYDAKSGNMTNIKVPERDDGFVYKEELIQVSISQLSGNPNHPLNNVFVGRQFEVVATVMDSAGSLLSDIKFILEKRADSDENPSYKTIFEGIGTCNYGKLRFIYHENTLDPFYLGETVRIHGWDLNNNRPNGKFADVYKEIVVDQPVTEVILIAQTSDEVQDVKVPTIVSVDKSIDSVQVAFSGPIASKNYAGIKNVFELELQDGTKVKPISTKVTSNVVELILKNANTTVANPADVKTVSYAGTEECRLTHARNPEVFVEAFTKEVDYRSYDANAEAKMKWVEDEVLRLTNEYREENGLQPLKLSEELRQLARMKAADIYYTGNFAHASIVHGSPSEMLTKFGVKWWRSSENLSSGYRDYDGYSNPQQIVDGWKRSPGHNANLLDPNVVYLGVGSDLNGPYTVQLFMSKKYTIDVLVSDADMGLITKVEGGNELLEGDSRTITAAPKQGYEFDYWTVNGNKIDETSTTLTYTPEDNDVITAHFKPIKYEIKTAAGKGGSVEGAGTYDYNTSITVSAKPDDGYHFLHWMENGNIVSTDAEYPFTVKNNRDLEAVFALSNPTVTIKQTGNGTVEGAGQYEYDQSVTVKATPAYGYVFGGWYNGENKVSEAAEYIFNVVDDITLTAEFVEKKFVNITVESNDATMGTVSGGGKFYFDDPDITLTAEPKKGHEFEGWYKENGDLLSEEYTYTFEVPEESQTITAKFVKVPERVVTVTTQGDDGKAVISGAKSYTYKTQATVSAGIKDDSVKFVKWTDKAGNTVSTQETYSFTIKEDTELIAVYEAVEKEAIVAIPRRTVFSATTQAKVEIEINGKAIDTDTNISSKYSPGGDFIENYKGIRVPIGSQVTISWDLDKSQMLSTYEVADWKYYNISQLDWTLGGLDPTDKAVARLISFEDKNTLTFTVTEDCIIDPTTKRKTSSVVTFLNGENVVAKLSPSAAGGILPAANIPVVTKNGYDFVGWYTEKGAKWETTSPVTKDLTVIAKFEKKPDTFQVTVNNGLKTETKEYQYQNLVTLKAADRSRENKVFSHWEKDGQVSGFDTTYTFVVSQNVYIEAVYKEAGEKLEAVPTIVIDEAPVYSAAGKVSFYAQVNIPTGFKLVEAGVVLKKDLSDADIQNNNLTLNTAGILRGKAAAISILGQFSITKGNAAKQKWSARGYLIYTDVKGVKFTVYSKNIVTGTPD